MVHKYFGQYFLNVYTCRKGQVTDDTMKIAVLSLGALLQFFALYIAFYSGLAGGIYLATLVSVAAMACMLAVRHLLFVQR